MTVGDKQSARGHDCDQETTSCFTQCRACEAYIEDIVCTRFSLSDGGGGALVDTSCKNCPVAKHGGHRPY
jgi:hypothetical protein